VTTAPSPRAIPAGELAAVALQQFDDEQVTVVGRLPDAVEAAMLAAAEGATGVLVTGSVTVAAQARLLFGAPDTGQSDAGPLEPRQSD